MRRLEIKKRGEFSCLYFEEGENFMLNEIRQSKICFFLYSHSFEEKKKKKKKKKKKWKKKMPHFIFVLPHSPSFSSSFSTNFKAKYTDGK